jgi:hypothetical protein
MIRRIPVTAMAKCLLVVSLLMIPRLALATSHICAYVNDDLTTPLNTVYNTVDGYKISGTTVTYLDPVSTNGYGIGGGYPSGGAQGMSIISGPSKSTTHLYIENDYSLTIAHLNVDRTDCTLTYDADYSDGDTAPPSPMIAADPVATTPNGKYLYVANNGNYENKEPAYIQLLKISSTGGLGSPISQIEVSGVIAQLATQSGDLLVATFPELDEVCAYSIALDGSLSTPSCSDTAGPPLGVTIDVGETCVYVGEGHNLGHTKVAAAPLSSGTLGSFTDYIFPHGKNSTAVTLSSNGGHLFISNSQSNQITAATVGSNCALSYDTISATGGTNGIDVPGQIAVSGSTVVLADFNQSPKGMTAPQLGIYTASGGRLSSLNSDGPLYPLTTTQQAVPFSLIITTISN